MKILKARLDLILRAVAYCAINSGGAFAEDCFRFHEALIILVKSEVKPIE